MEKTINIIKYKISKLFLYTVISLIGFIRKYSDDTTKLKIDNMVSDSIKSIIK